jgi:hypothetical protein
MAALGVSNPADLLNLDLGQGWLTYGTTFTPNGGGNPKTFASLGVNATTNTGGVTTYANAQFVNSRGVTVSVNRIALNTDSFAFTGQVMSNGYLTAVGNVQPTAFGGLAQPQIIGAAIIHELLHVVGAIPSDGGNSTQSQTNSETVKRNCF